MGETCCLLRVDLKSLCISSCLRLTLKMLKDAEGRFWLAGPLVTHPFPWLSYDAILISSNVHDLSIVQFFKNQRSAKIWGPMSPSWFLDILCSFSSWCANTSTSLTSSFAFIGWEGLEVFRNLVSLVSKSTNSTSFCWDLSKAKSKVAGLCPVCCNTYIHIIYIFRNKAADCT